MKFFKFLLKIKSWILSKSITTRARLFIITAITMLASSFYITGNFTYSMFVNGEGENEEFSKEVCNTFEHFLSRFDKTTKEG